MQGITERLEENPLRKELIHHPFFKEVRTSDLTREQVGVFLGQWCIRCTTSRTSSPGRSTRCPSWR